MATFGLQCDAITKSGQRCKNTNTWEIPTGYQTQYKPVRLCSCHVMMEDRLRKNNKRLPLHHDGWLGAYNKYQYGNIVTIIPVVDWETVTFIVVPKFWA